MFVFVFAAVAVAIGPGNDPASWHIISHAPGYQSDNPITYPELDNESDSDNELIKNDELGYLKEVKESVSAVQVCLPAPGNSQLAGRDILSYS